MKTRLLKKIRKQYSIYRIDDAGDCKTYSSIGEDMGFPFYMLCKKYDHFGFYTFYHKDKHVLMDKIVKIAFSRFDNDRYQRKFVKPVIKEKVYFVK